MANHSPFCLHVLSLLSDLPGIHARGMFGGFGLYQDASMFGLIAYDILYFKVDGQTEAYFSGAGSQPFVYEAPGRKPVQMSYWEAPLGSLDQSEKLIPWAALGIAAANRAAAAKKPKRARSSSPLRRAQTPQRKKTKTTPQRVKPNKPRPSVKKTAAKKKASTPRKKSTRRNVK